VIVYSIMIAAVGVLGLEMLTGNSGNAGSAIVLITGWVMSIPIGLEVRRASTPRSGAS
jgi:hypothetical protein